jgi:hypothetical protein
MTPPVPPLISQVVEETSVVVENREAGKQLSWGDITFPPINLWNIPNGH